jgi:hypothetical protein
MFLFVLWKVFSSLIRESVGTDLEDNETNVGKCIEVERCKHYGFLDDFITVEIEK